MKTLEELQDLASQDKLDEIDTLAALAQAWGKIGNEGDSDWATPNKEGCETVVRHYHPTRDKGQAWDLMIKKNVLPSRYMDMFSVLVLSKESKEDVDHEDPLIAVTIAFILAMQGEE